MQVRPHKSQDETQLLAFAASVPSEDRRFLKEDVSDPAVVRAWSQESQVLRYLAWEDDSVVGYVSLHPLGGWSEHVAEMRLLVAPEARAHGYGQRLVRQALTSAVQNDFSKVVVEAIADHDQTLGMLQANGFSPEALLVDHVRDRGGDLRDLMVLTCRTDELVDDMAVTGIEDALS